MKNAIVLLSVLVSFSSSAFADRNTYGLDLDFECDEKNLEVAVKLMDRLPEGFYEGVNSDGLKCSVEVENTSIAIKTENFVGDPERLFDCLAKDEIACFELNPMTYTALKGPFNSGNLFSVSLDKDTESELRVRSKRRMGGHGAYRLKIKDSDGQRTISIREKQKNRSARTQSCTVQI